VKPDRARSGLRWLGSRVALAGLSLLLALVCAEGVFRVWTARQRARAQSDDDWRIRVTEMNRTLYRRSDDPRLVYEPAPGVRHSMGGWHAAFNQAGIRDDREIELRPSGRRVALLGDSIAWGEHLSLDQTLGRRLEERLDGAEVLNFGVTGYDTAQELAWYERAARPFGSTDVLLVFCLNDALIMSGPYNAWANEEESARKRAQDDLLERVAPIRAETVEWVMGRREQEATFTSLARIRTLLRTATYHRSSDYTDEFLVMYDQPEVWSRIERALVDLGAAIEADGARAWLAISPVLREWRGYRWAWIHERVADAARSAGFEVIDPLSTWRDAHSPEELRFFGDSLHYSAAGNRAFADVIAEEMGEQGAPP
jgi:hypothetical protein